MANDNHNQEEINSTNNSNKLAPVKGPFEKVLSVGSRIIIGGVVVVFVGNIILAPLKVRGASRSARVQFEQKQAEIQKQLEQEMQKEIDEKE